MPLPVTVPSTDGVVLPILDLGGRGPLLLCSHATGFHGLVWRPMARTLADRWHSVAWDYRAHGDAAPPANDHFVWEGYGEDASAVAAALGPTGLVAVGHSMGGAALVMAELAALAFVVQNFDRVSFEFLLFDFRWPLWIMLVVFFLLGALTGVILGRRSKASS